MHSKKSFVAGLISGLLIVSGVIATDIAVTRTTSDILVNGEKKEFEAYNINGYNYFRIKDLAEVLNFNVEWNDAERQVLIDTSKPYEKVAESSKSEVPKEETLPLKNTEEIIRITQSDEPFRPLVGQTVETEKYEGINPTGEKTTFTIVKEKPIEPKLPEATCDWSQFPEIELPTAVVKDFGNGNIGVLNLYETRRMQYTLYNLIGSNELTWKDGKLIKNKNGTPKVAVSFELENGDDKTQVMWPYRESELKKVFDSCPVRKWCVIVYDTYKDGKYLHTDYYLQ